MHPKIVADYDCEIGEGPIWNPANNHLYWTDIPAGRMFSLNTVTGKHHKFYDGRVVGGFTIQRDGNLLLFMEKGAVAILKQGELSYVITDIPAEKANRFNDVVSDPVGRVFCGTMPSNMDRLNEGLGRLYKLDTDGSMTLILDHIYNPNGMAFTPDHTQMYYTDSLMQKIYIFDYNIKNGTLSNQRVFVDTSGKDGVPDGLTVDSDGYVWSAQVMASSLIRYSPEGDEVQRALIPTRAVTSLTFAGKDCTDIYVTTAGGKNKTGNLSGAGALYQLNLGIEGIPEYQSNISSTESKLK